MNLDELRSVQSKERQKDSLQHLRPSFYREVGEYIGELEGRRERAAEAADDPFSSPEVGRLTDEIETARDVVEAIYERRMGKLVKQSSLAAAGMPADDEGLTAEESDLFEDLVSSIESNKKRVLDVLDGEEPAGATEPTEPTTAPASDEEPSRSDSESPDRTADSQMSNGASPPPPEEPPVVDEQTAESPAREDPSSGVSVADAMGAGPTDGSTPNDGGPPVPPSDEEQAASTDGDSSEATAGDRDDATRTEEPADETATTGRDGDVDRVTVRITREIGSILGVDDREYTLESDDVVTLPEQNATPLVERDAAEPLE